MLRQFYSTSYGRARCYEGLFGRYMDAYAEYLWKLRYSGVTAKAHFQIIRSFGRWMKRRNWGMRQFNEQVIDLFLRSRSRSFKWKYRAPLRLLLQLMRSNGIVKTRPPNNGDGARQRLIESFRGHLADERGLSPETIIYQVAIASDFVHGCCEVGPRLRIHTLEAKKIVDFLRRRVRESGRYQHKLSASLRSFLRFLFLHRKTSTDLSLAVTSGPRWKLAGLPPVLKMADLRLMLRHCDCRTIKGRRDRAVLLLMMRLGLRSGEVVRLELDDVDWQQGEILVRGKGRQFSKLPLPEDVGQAIACYLKRDRPASESRRLFVRIRAPQVGWATASTVGRIVKRALQRAGLRPAHMGSHILRHTLATQLIRRDKSLSEIGQVLRHRHPDTTAIYAKVNFQQLRCAAAPWPGARR